MVCNHNYFYFIYFSTKNTLVNDDWWKGTVDGKSGIFPQNHVKKIAPPIKAKRPWVPPTAAKSAFSTSSSTSSYSYNTPPAQYIQPPQQNQPYSYPPPPTALYQAPPAQPPVQSYGQPSTVAVVGEPPHEENKVGSMAKKFGNSRLGEAVVWGAGATRKYTTPFKQTRVLIFSQ
jgi:hypothetical protein